MPSTENVKSGIIASAEVRAPEPLSAVQARHS